VTKVDENKFSFFTNVTTNNVNFFLIFIISTIDRKCKKIYTVKISSDTILWVLRRREN